jgi:toxin ParE1/3/4
VIVRYRARALADIEQIFAYLNPRSPAGAVNVLRSIFESIRLISELPQNSPTTPIPNVRVRVVRRYRYKIFYRIEPDAVVIVHVRHTSRMPWV